MKKLICLVLVLVCSFALFSCGDKNGDGGSVNSKVETISKIVSESVPTKIVTQSEYVIGDETLTGQYTNEIDRTRGNERLTFVYTRYAKIEEMSPSPIKTLSGVVRKNKEGNYSCDGDEWKAGDATAYLPLALNIDEARFASYEISEDGTDLTAEIAPAESKRTLGTDIDAEGNITLKIQTNGQYLYEVEVSYTAKDTGALVVILTSYDYSQIKLDFAAEELEQG